jgi:hypothetical protein
MPSVGPPSNHPDDEHPKRKVNDVLNSPTSTVIGIDQVAMQLLSVDQS